MIYKIESPKGIDTQIQKIQTHLHNKLNWGDIDVYGRVYRNPLKKNVLCLEAYVGNNEYKDVYTNDFKNGSVFFVEDDVHKSKDGVRFTNKVKIVFMINLKKIYPNITHRADMESEMKAIDLVRQNSIFSFESLEKGVKQVLGEFYTEGIKTDDMHPFHVFSITGEVSYIISCLTK